MRANTKIRICRNCGEDFEVYDGIRKNKMPKGVKPKNYVTCSSKCSKEYNYSRRQEYDKIRRKGE